MSETLVGGGSLVGARLLGTGGWGREVLMGGIAVENDSIEEVTM
jgi:hypothetical protein